jgi:hypothetical protein
VAQKYKMTANGSARRAASGSANLQRWKNGEQPAPSQIELQVIAFRERLERQCAAIPEPGRSALIASACANYTAVLLGEQKLLRLSRRPHNLDDIVSNLAPHSSNLLRALKALGVVGADADDEPDPMAAIAAAAQRVIDERPKEAASASASGA